MNIDKTEKLLIAKCVNIDKLLSDNMDLIRDTKVRISKIQGFEPVDSGELKENEQPQIDTLVRHLEHIIRKIENNNNELSSCYSHLQKLI